ncbi:MAG: 50S ribosomal protein L4 [Pseudomonadota bacterium]
MPKADVYNINGDKVSEVELVSTIFDVTVKNHLIHQVVVAQLANKRAGTASTKGRSLVSGGGKKPYRQKGTGRARAGTLRSPTRRGGGTIFGPVPRSYAQKVSKKIRKQALRMALTVKQRENALCVVDGFVLSEAKTKHFVEAMKKLKIANVLIVADAPNQALELSSRNIPRVKVLRTEGLNVHDVIKFSHLILLEPAIKQIEKRLLA